MQLRDIPWVNCYNVNCRTNGDSRKYSTFEFFEHRQGKGAQGVS